MWAVFVLEKQPGSKWEDEDWDEEPVDIFTTKIEASRCAMKQPRNNNRRVVLRRQNLKM